MAEWIYGNRYLSESEMTNNADIIKSFLIERGWTLNAICGILGNMQAESTINPAIWQNLDAGNMSVGFGLVQWTPATNFTNWADENGFNREDGYAQLKWIDEETERFGQWIQTAAYPIAFSDFKVSPASADYLASAFLKNFERAGVEVEELRKANARAWYTYFNSGGGGSSDTPSTPTPRPNIKRLSKLLLMAIASEID